MLARRRRGSGWGGRVRGSGGRRGRGRGGRGKRGIVDEGNVRATNRIVLEALDATVLVENRTLSTFTEIYLRKSMRMEAKNKRQGWL